MQLNYFGAIRLVMGLLPKMREQQRGHVVNISLDRRADQPAAVLGVRRLEGRARRVEQRGRLASWSATGSRFTSIHMPLVRTPMIAPTKIYDKFPTISPAQAADLVIKAMVERPHEINTAARQRSARSRTRWRPRSAFRVLQLAYQVFPDSAAAKGDGDDARESEQIMLAKVFKGIHW